MPAERNGSPGYPPLQADLTTNQRLLGPSPWIRLCYTTSQNSGKLLRLPTDDTMKPGIKDTGEHPEAGASKARSGRVLRAGTSVPMELGCVIFPLRVRVCAHAKRPHEDPNNMGFGELPGWGTSPHARAPQALPR